MLAARCPITLWDVTLDPTGGAPKDVRGRGHGQSQRRKMTAGLTLVWAAFVLQEVGGLFWSSGCTAGRSVPVDAPVSGPLPCGALIAIDAVACGNNEITRRSDYRHHELTLAPRTEPNGQYGKCSQLRDRPVASW